MTAAAEGDRFKRLLARLHQGIVTVDRDGRVEFANPAARRLLGAPHLRGGDPLPQPWPELSLRRLLAGAFRPGASLVRARVAPDEQRAFALAVIPAGPDEDTAVLVVTDLAPREQSERAEREFVANAAHELRTPLTTIIGAIEVLQEGARERPADRDRFLAHIERESRRLGRLTHALLTLARYQTGEQVPSLVPVEVRPLLEQIGGEVSPVATVPLEIDCPAGLVALTDRDLVAQALLNLATNASQHTDSGRIELAARATDDEASLVVEVRDTGRGIPWETQERIFDRFYRGDGRDARGFGLGLAIVRQAVRALDGIVEIESTPGDGTTVRMTLSAANVTPAARG